MAKSKKKLTLQQFITTLVQFYNEGIPETHFCCRFFLQAATFSFELHDSRKSCFTSQSLVFESKVYWWGDEERNQNILNDILTKAKELNNVKTNVGDVEF